MKQLPFFVMPGSALSDLREEMEIIEGERRSKLIIYRYGQRCGRGLVEHMGVEAENNEEVGSILPALWMETGLSRLAIDSRTDSEIVVHMEESIEGQEGRQCDFARGYLSGIVSALLGRRFEADEVECVSEGYPVCVVQLYDVPDILKQQRLIFSNEQPKYELERGYSYLIREENQDQAIDVFVDAVHHGYSGLCITREFPDKVRERYSLDGIPLLWLSSDQMHDFSREPMNIPLLYGDIKTFITENSDPIVLLSGLEYLISQNGFPKVLKFIQLVDDKIAIANAVLIAPISPLTLREQDLKMLEKEMRVYLS